MRALQGCRWYRRLGRGFARLVTLKTQERPAGRTAALAIRVEARWCGRTIGGVWLLYQASGLPANIDWWGVSLEVTPALRGLGVGTKLIREIMRLATERGGKHLGAMVREDNWPSRRLCEKHGFKRETRSGLAEEWAASHGESRTFMLLWRNLGDAPDPVFPDA